MALIIPIAIIVSALVVVIVAVLLGTLVHTISVIQDTNKQLMILVAGKEAKPEALRALVASEKPPQKNLGGIATGKMGKKGKKPLNTDYTLTVGGGNGV